MGIVAQGIGKVIGDPPNRILTGIDLRIGEGEFVSLTGRSGSGKSTLLYILSSLDAASEGVLEIDGVDVARMNRRELYRFRNEKMVFVFQFHYLIAELTALENLLLPAKKSGAETRLSRRAEGLLEKFDLGSKMHRLPRQLSGGEQQRVAIARALTMNPRYLFADEPTGSLDSVNGAKVMQIIREAHAEGTSVILVTHDAGFAAQAQRQVRLKDGRIVAGEA